MILDIALPMRPGDSPDRRGGMTLLEEIIERGIYRLPGSVVGLTGFEDLQQEFASRFQSRLWTLEYYNSAGGGWAERLRAKSEYIVARVEQAKAISYGVDVGVIVALHTPELRAVRDLPWDWSPARSLDEVGYYYEGQCPSEHGSHTVVAAAAPRMGMVATAILASKMILKFRPRLLIMAGICAGVKGVTRIGDLLLADPAWDWQMGKYRDGVFFVAPDQIDVPTAVRERFVQLAEDKKYWVGLWDSFRGLKPETPPSAKVGPVTSGSAVLADSRILEEVKEQHRQLVGVEMELYGMYAAVRDSAPPSPIAFGMKSVCDFADGRKSDQYQEYAAHVSAGGLAAFCQRYLTDIVQGNRG